MAVNFNALVEEFKRTNWQDPGTWHFAPKILVLLAILIGLPVAGFFADTQGQIEELEKGVGEEAKLKEEYVGLPGDNDEVASPSAENSAPTADQARLPSSKMPTMPTMMAISRAGEPSSGRADRSTSL